MQKTYCLLFFILIITGFTRQASAGPETGIPFFTNISPKEYNANGQNWAAVQDSNGLVYFANAGGIILQYDGVVWNSIPLGNGSIVRDIQIDTDGKIFVGMQDDLGYLQSDESGNYVYKSLIQQVDCEHNEFGDIWKIGLTNDYIYFLERHHLFRLPKTSLADTSRLFQTIHSKKRFHSLFQGRQNQLFVHQVDVGLMETDADSMHLVLNGDFFKNDLLAGVLSFSANKWLIVTRKRGLYIYSENGAIHPFKTNADDLLRRSQPYHTIRLSDGNFAIASKFGGLFIISPTGKLTQKIDESAGLASNTVWSVFEDSQHGLWLSLNKGIAHVDYASPFTNIDERNGLKGSVHDIIRHEGKLFITTNYGLFVSGQKKSVPGQITFKPVQGINTSGWGMLSVGNSLFISANSGIYKYKNNRVRLLLKYDPWGFYRSKLDPKRIYIGLAKGVASFSILDDGSIRNEGKIPGIDIEARTVAEDAEGNLWVASSYQGVMQAASIGNYFMSGIDPAITHFDESSGIPGNRFALLSETEKEILFTTPQGIYAFNDTNNNFNLNTKFEVFNQKKLADENYMLARSDNKGGVWSHIGHRIVLNKPEPDGNYSLCDTIFWGIPEEEIQCIYPDKNQVVWFGHRNGIFKYDPKNRHQTTPDFKTLIREITLNNQFSLPPTGSLKYSENIPEIHYAPDNMLRFKFAAPFFTKAERTIYQYQLMSFNHDWSSWVSETQKDYTNLPHGKYTFKVKAKNVYGQIREAAPYSFVIAPPWYHTAWAYLVFLLIFAGITVILAWALIAYSKAKAIIEHQSIEEHRRKTEEVIRSQVAADFHDELGTRITRISLFSEILKNELKDVSDSARGYLEKISENSEKLYDETRDFIWQLDPQKDTLTDFIARMKSFGDELFENTSIRFEVKHNVDDPAGLKLDMDQRRNLIRIIKEAMHNALKYAKCKNVNFEISRDNNQLCFILSDDGIGIPMDKDGDGTGLKNIQQRAAKIQASLEINSQPKQGTRIELSMTI